MKFQQMDIAMDADNVETVTSRRTARCSSTPSRATVTSSWNPSFGTVRSPSAISFADSASRHLQADLLRLNSNYKVVRHLVENLGRKTHGQSEEILSIVIASQGIEGMVDALLDSDGT